MNSGKTKRAWLGLAMIWDVFLYSCLIGCVLQLKASSLSLLFYWVG